MSDLVMTPAAGERLMRFVGDRVRFTLHPTGGIPAGWRGVLRTTLGRGRAARDEAVATHGGATWASVAWRDIPLIPDGDGWSIELSLTEVGYFRAKAYAVDRRGHQHWPAGGDVGIPVHPDAHRTANTIYCAFVRAFGETKRHHTTRHGLLEEQFSALDHHGYALLPPSGKFRDLANQLPHIIDDLGCRIVHLLPVNPTPTTYARFGRYGSPYAALDFTAIDPALVVFDKRTTAVDQFRELAYAVHLKGAKLFLDLAINHTGWGSRLMDEHPEWFVRNPDGTFHSPGAWGTTWEDLVELDHQGGALWTHLADAFLTWCQRGVDGFRCDAGYMVPLPAWQYITARVRQEFPDTVFLLEGLGGGLDVTASLLTEGGMQWAYSELFQNYSGPEIASYLDYAHAQSAKTGVMVHYSETHDNDRLAKGGRAWSLLRNRLSALTSVCGGYGFTCGVEWLAAEKIEVHQSRGLSWGSQHNLVTELAALTRLVSDHPCFFDGAALTRVSGSDSPVYALRRDSAEGRDHVLVLANTDVTSPQRISIPLVALKGFGKGLIDLLDPDRLVVSTLDGETLTIELAAGDARCLADTLTARGLSGTGYRRARAQAAWAIQALAQVLPLEDIGIHDWHRLAALVDAAPVTFLAALPHLDPTVARNDLLAAFDTAIIADGMPQVIAWNLRDLGCVTLIPPGHWLLVRDSAPFSATLRLGPDGQRPVYTRSIPSGEGHIAAFAPPDLRGRPSADAQLLLERFTTEGRQAHGRLRFLSGRPELTPRHPEQGLALLTNGIGGMARLGVDLGSIQSKYDCLLGANLHPSAPCDRHVLAKRARVWVNADGFITPLDRANLAGFEAGPPARWTFVANAGDGRTVPITLTVDMLEGRNTTVLRFQRLDGPPPWGVSLPAGREVRLTVRVDLEDRSFHSETRREPGSERHFNDHTTALIDRAGFSFAPVGRALRVWSDRGNWHSEPEWCTAIPHPIEASRGMTDMGDAWSPGWFDVPLDGGADATVVACADAEDPPAALIAGFATARKTAQESLSARAAVNDELWRTLATAAGAYVVRRGKLKTVIAGYPWFLDWGRDSLIAARGLIAAGMTDEVRQLLCAFGRFEEGGTLPNFLNGDDASNRDTSDAPLWFGIACSDLAAVLGNDVYATPVDGGGRTLLDVLRAIAVGYLRGTANGIRVDIPSGLVWSPSHFTWMDTNHPAGTPREGYPVEIQCLWIRLLRQLEKLRVPTPEDPWWALAERAERSLHERFWLEDRGWFADLLIAPAGVPALQAVSDTALRSNQLLAVSLGLVDGTRARRAVAAAARYLVVPGALRSLAPLPVQPPLPIRSHDGRLLNNPDEPYWGRYEGDEDTQRKPAYHNGTAWTWTFPGFCEALARAWDFSPAAVDTARAYLSSIDRLLVEGCFGHLPEIIDGDTPHTQRGCDAQAWGATEALRVWKLLNSPQR